MVLRIDYDKGKITSTPCDWKDALPHRNESNILCLSVGNTSYRWAMHRGLQENFTPCVFWKYVPTFCCTIESTIHNLLCFGLDLTKQPFSLFVFLSMCLLAIIIISGHHQ